MVAQNAFNVDATALFFARPHPDLGDLLTDLNTRLADIDGCHLTMSPLSHADWWLLACKHFHIMITYSDAPADHAKIETALRSPVTTLRRFDYDQVAQSHQAHVAIEIGDGEAPLPPEARMIMQEFGDKQDCTPEMKMKALHWTLQFIARHQGFLAAHFGPSDRMFCPDELGEAAVQDMPVALLTHPVPTLPEQGPNGKDGYGLQLRNSQHLEGPAIELEGLPVSVPLKTAVALHQTINKAHRAGKITLSHGRVLKPSEKICLYTREVAADDDTPNGRIILSFWKDRGHDAPKPKATKPAPQTATTKPEPAATAAPAPSPAPAPAKGLVVASVIKTEAQLEADKAYARAVMDDLYGEDSTEYAEHSKIMQTQEDAMRAELGLEDTSSRANKGLFGWLAGLLPASPMQTGLRMASVAVILGLTLIWNPYGEFTGGLSTDFAASAQASLPEAGDIMLAFAQIWEK